ncbi:AAA family ATPase [Roseovarius aquimarinus]|uniref:AAA family ATPase n=1 Tax=Roseovarius aquimarinus TaxID=1229156 RepID=A0ABW7IB73_9RHOB
MSHTSHTPLQSPPVWAPLATTALRRLRAHHAMRRAEREERAEPAPRKMSDHGPGLLAALAATPSALQIPPDAQEGERSLEGDPQGLRIPLSELALTLRLCASFGTAEAVEALLAPGAVTVLALGEDGPGQKEAQEMLVRAILPAGIDVASCARGGGLGTPPDLAVVDGAQEIAGARGAPLRLSPEMQGALEAPCPVLILLGGVSQMPPALAADLPAPLKLAPLDREIAVALLAAWFDAEGAVDPALRRELYGALPEDAALRDLSQAALALAMRSATPRGAVERLCRTALQARQAPKTGPTLDEIEGYGAAEIIARRMAADLRAWAEGRADWAEMERSLLLYGPPGTGKSHLARAIAGSAGARIVQGSFGAWQAAGHLGDMLRAMRKTFEEAKEDRPAILIIDEIDGVGDRADPSPMSRSYRQQVINGFLLELDHLAATEGVMLVATTNYMDRIDAAVLRPGRIDLRAEVPLPGPQALGRMIRAGLGAGIGAGTPQEEMSRLTRAAAGGTAADLEAALRAARGRAREARRPVTPADLLAALAPEADATSGAWERRAALHECGHAIVGACLGLGRITRLALTRQGGQAWLAYAAGKHMAADFEDEMTYTMAGRAAERLMLGAVSGGAGGGGTCDLAQATRTATGLDICYGLGAEGPLWRGAEAASYLEQPANAARIRARLEEAEARAAQILTPRRSLLARMAEDLERVGILEGTRLDAWLTAAAKKRVETVGGKAGALKSSMTNESDIAAGSTD